MITRGGVLGDAQLKGARTGDYNSGATHALGTHHNERWVA